MSGTMAWAKHMYQDYMAEKAIEPIYQRLKEKPREVVERYKRLLENQHKNRPVLDKILKPDSVPLELIAARRVLYE